MKHNTRYTVSRFALIFFPLLLLVGGIVALLYFNESNSTFNGFRETQRMQVRLFRETLQSELGGVLSDLRFLSELNELHRYLGAPGTRTRIALEQEFLNFSKNKRKYDQLRYIDNDGNEVARVNFDAGSPAVVPPSELQNKAARYYFKDAMALQAGQVYISAFDLNVERGEVELPFKPMIRFALAVRGPDGKRQGLVILNYLGRQLIQRLKREAATYDYAQLALLNRNGYWITAKDPGDEWGFMFPERHERSFANRYPAAWSHISGSDAGQFSGTAGLFSFETVDPRVLAGNDVNGTEPAGRWDLWKVVSWVPEGVVEGHMARFRYGVLSLFIAVIAVLAVGTGMLVSAFSSLKLKTDYTREIIDRSPALICGLRPDGRINFVNRAVEQTTGYESAQLVGGNWWQIFFPGEAGPQVKDLLGALRKGPVRDYEMQLIAHDGSPRCVVWNFLKRLDESDDLDELVGFGMDITVKRQMDSMKREFVSIVSHELRTPLTSIRGALGLVAGEVAGSLPERARGLVDIALKNSEQLILLINDILDLQKLESGHMKFEIIPHPLMPLLRRALETNRAYAEHLDVELATVEEAPGVVVAVDEQRFLQVMTNLLSNAVKFSPAGSQVRVSARRVARDRVRVAVADSGPGIPEGYDDRIFEKFTQVDSSDARAKGGTGLGLNISRTIVQRFGGSIGFESVPGDGAMFYFDLPVLDPASR